ncbi:hypothetical protein Tco_0712702, partial [Tanacetum coccineum]
EPRWLRLEEEDGGGDGWKRTVASKSMSTIATGASESISTIVGSYGYIAPVMQVTK